MINSFSERALEWSRRVFGSYYDRITPKQRALRLLEETLELVQAEGGTVREAELVLEQVFGKPVGDPFKELGGVVLCLAAYAGIRKWDFFDAFEIEYQRIQDPELMARVLRRNLPGGDKVGLL